MYHALVIEAGPCVVTLRKTVEKDVMKLFSWASRTRRQSQGKAFDVECLASWSNSKKHLAEAQRIWAELNLGDTVTVELFNDATFAGRCRYF